MANDFRTYITNTGLAAEVAAKASGQAVRLSHIAVGQNLLPVGSDPKAQTSLLSEVHRVDIATVMPASDDAAQLIAEALIPATVGGFVIAEMGIFDDQGRLYAYARQPGDYKPVASAGMVNDYLLRLRFKSSNQASITLQYEGNMAYVARDQMTGYLATLGQGLAQVQLEQLRQADRIKIITGEY